MMSPAPGQEYLVTLLTGLCAAPRRTHAQLLAAADAPRADIRNMAAAPVFNHTP